MEINRLEQNTNENNELNPAMNQHHRISTGITKLDELLSGGFPPGRIILVSGTPGSGKTIVCFHYLNAGIQHGDKCIFFSTDEHIDSLIHEALEFGFDFQQAIDQNQVKFHYLNVESDKINQQIEDEITQGGYQRVILDSLSPLAEKPIWMVSNGNEVIPQESSMTTTSIPLDSIQATRLHLRRIISIFKKQKISTLVTSELPEGSRGLSRNSVTEFLTDGIIFLDIDPTMDRRKLMIRKMRKTKHTLKPQNLIITETGIQLQ
jgi:circadian clock protein KaiC